ncbi:hypothetical protein DIPPA_10763 [Diplonema papillatum]|nr:hypothetical protein DIPPA_10763 [Diplonema papillatum]
MRNAPPEEIRETSLRALHADLLEALEYDERGHGSERRGELLKDVIERMEDLIARDATDRADRLQRLEMRQQELVELEALLASQEGADGEAVRQVAELAKETVALVAKECRQYQQALRHCQIENETLRNSRKELERMANLQQQISPVQEKAERLAEHLVQAVQEKCDLEQKNASLQANLLQAQDKLAQFEEAAQADIAELTALADQREKDRQALLAQCRELSMHLPVDGEGGGRLSIEKETGERDSTSRPARDTIDPATTLHGGRVSHVLRVEREYRAGYVAASEYKALQQELERAHSRARQLAKELNAKHGHGAILSDQIPALGQNVSFDNIEYMRIQEEKDRRIDESTRTVQNLHDEVGVLEAELQRARENEEATMLILEDIKQRELAIIRERDAELRHVRELENTVEDLSTEVERERAAKEDLSRTVAELQQQTLHLAKEKGHLAAELNMRRGDAETNSGAFSRVSSGDTARRTVEAMVLQRLKVAAGGPNDNKKPPAAAGDPRAKITELESKLASMRSALQSVPRMASVSNVGTPSVEKL